MVVSRPTGNLIRIAEAAIDNSICSIVGRTGRPTDKQDRKIEPTEMNIGLPYIRTNDRPIIFGLSAR